MSKTESVVFQVSPDDLVELDRLVEAFGLADRSALLHEAIAVMASRDRAQRLESIQGLISTSVTEKFGRSLTEDESLAITTASVKGKLPEPSALSDFEPMIQDAIRSAAARHAERSARGED